MRRHWLTMVMRNWYDEDFVVQEDQNNSVCSYKMLGNIRRTCLPVVAYRTPFYEQGAHEEFESFKTSSSLGSRPAPYLGFVIDCSSWDSRVGDEIAPPARCIGATWSSPNYEVALTTAYHRPLRLMTAQARHRPPRLPADLSGHYQSQRRERHEGLQTRKYI